MLQAERLREAALGGLPPEVRDGRPPVRDGTGDREGRVRDAGHVLLLDERREQRLEARVGVVGRRPAATAARASRRIDDREVGLRSADVGD